MVRDGIVEPPLGGILWKFKGRLPGKKVLQLCPKVRSDQTTRELIGVIMRIQKQIPSNMDSKQIFLSGDLQERDLCCRDYMRLQEGNTIGP